MKLHNALNDHGIGNLAETGGEALTMQVLQFR